MRLDLGWDADRKRKRWEATGRTREGALDKLRKARIGKVPIATLSPTHVRTIYKAVSVESSLGNANKVYRVLLAALSDAEREGIVPRNVAKLARRAPRTPVQTARFVGPHRIHALGKARKRRSTNSAESSCERPFHELCAQAVYVTARFVGQDSYSPRTRLRGQC